MKSKAVSIRIPFFTLVAFFATLTTQTRAEETTETISGVTYTYDTQGTTARVTAFDNSVSAVTILSEVKGKTVTEITQDAFADASNIVSLYIPASVTTIADKVFADCTYNGLTVTYMATTKPNADAVPYTAFANGITLLVPGQAIEDYIADTDWQLQCNMIKIVDLYYSLSGNKSITGRVGTSTTTDLYISSKVSTAVGVITVPNIADNAFEDDAILESVHLLEGITSVGASAFKGCTNLNSITLPASLSELGTRIFSGCTKLSSVEVAEGNNNFCTKNNMLLSADGTTLLLCPATQTGRIEIPEGVTTITSGAFEGCTGITEVILPSTLSSIGDEAFAGCTTLSKVYANGAEPATLGTDAFKDCTIDEVWDLNSLSMQAYARTDWANVGNSLKFYYTFITDANDPNKVTIYNDAALSDLFYAMNDSESGLTSAQTIDLDSNIRMKTKELDLSTMSHDNVASVMDYLPTIGNYDGTMNGATISNLTVRSSGLFGTLGAQAVVNNLMLDSATIYIDPTDEAYQTAEDGTRCMSLLAQTNSGAVNNFGFAGRVIVDESRMGDYADYAVTLFGTMDNDAAASGFLYLTDVEATGDDQNKRCITLKQNLATASKGTKKTKVATNSGNTKSAFKSTGNLFGYSDDEINKSIRSFSDEEFANGAVAYWLNWSDQGYTGTYRPIWSQGPKYPIAATAQADGTTNALYAIDWGTTDMNMLTNAPVVANNGQPLTIHYATKPKSFKVGNEEIAIGETSTSFKFDNTKTVSIAWADGAPTATPIIKSEPKPDFVIKGRVISSTDGETTLTVRSLLSTVMGSGTEVIVPHQGIYLVICNNRTTKVIIK